MSPKAVTYVPEQNNAGEGLGGEGERAVTQQESSGQDKAIPALTSRARELRHSDTLAEKLAWRLLRNRQLLHYKFRRQLPLNNAIVDFCCLSLKLVVELDGAGHAHESQATRDRQRDRELEKGGYRVLRFPNGIVLKAPTEFVRKRGVHRPVGAGSLERAPSLKILKHHVSYPPHPPAPLPRWGEGAETLSGCREM
jgi:very-short-patch-repair endonuclease